MAAAWPWIAFNVAVLALLALDLGVFQRRAHRPSVREALLWSAFWIVLALLFAVGVFVVEGREPATAFLTGYLVEKSLSVDNLFVFAAIFGYFAIPDEQQHRVLYWGILGALVARGAMIALGATLLEHFHWLGYVLGAFLVVTGVRMLSVRPGVHDPGETWFVRLVQHVVPLEPRLDGGRFLVRRAGRLLATPLLLCLLVVEAADIVFAVDSIPAVFAVTTDPFLVFTSNILAILGLRALYFALAGVLRVFHYLRIGLALVLAFVGAKMLLVEVVPISAGVALGVVAVVLLAAVMASLRWPADPPVIAPNALQLNDLAGTNPAPSSASVPGGPAGRR